MPKDVLVWETFISENPEAYDQVEYNIRVGTGIKYIPETQYQLQNMATKLSQMRIDVVGYKNGTIELIELKPIGGATLIGQLVTYPILYKQTFEISYLPKSKGICFYSSPDIKYVAKQLNVEIKEVTAPNGFYV